MVQQKSLEYQVEPIYIYSPSLICCYYKDEEQNLCIASKFLDIEFQCHQDIKLLFCLSLYVIV